MTKIKKINYCLLLTIFCLLLFLPVQSQTNQPEIILTWSTDSYVPLDYSGKALPSSKSVIEVTADLIPKTINPQNLNFRWFLGEYLQKTASGLGKETFRFISQATAGDIHSIRLEVVNSNGAILSSAHQPIKIIQPQIVFQTKAFSLTPIGLIQKYQIPANQETIFTAQPYFFNIKDINELNYTWNLGGKEASQISGNNPNIFILKVNQLAQSLKQDLRVWAENKNNPIQRTQTTAEINILP